MKKYFFAFSLLFLLGLGPTVHAACIADDRPENPGECVTDLTSYTSCTCPTDYVSCMAANNDATSCGARFTAPATTPAGQPTGFVPLTNIPGLTTGAGDVASQSGLATFLNNLYKYLIGVAAVLAVIEIIWGGLEIATESVAKKTAGKERIQQALLGLVLVLSPALVFTIINPSILNLSINLPPINQTPGTGGTTTTTTANVDPTTQCQISGTANILQNATCPSSAAANAWTGCDTAKNTLQVSSKSVTTTNPSNGVQTTTVTALCSRNQPYTFIDTTNGIDPVVEVQPLVTAPTINGTAADPNNGSSALQFVNICNSIGRKTCISDLPLVTFATPCGLTGTNAASPWKCYREILSCQDISYFSALTSLTQSAVADELHCRDNPGWTPYQ